MQYTYAYLPMMIAAKGVREAQMVHVLNDSLFFLSGVPLMLCFNIDIVISGTNRPTKICNVRKDGGTCM